MSDDAASNGQHNGQHEPTWAGHPEASEAVPSEELYKSANRPAGMGPLRIAIIATSSASSDQKASRSARANSVLPPTSSSKVPHHWSL